MSFLTWHRVFVGAEWACWGAFGLVWVSGAIYNLLRSPRVRQRLRNPSVIVGLGIYLIYRLTPAHLWQSLIVHDYRVQLLGLPILLGATAFTLWARAALGIMWSSAPLAREEHRLRTEGPYGITRHPIYTGILGMLLGTAFLAGLGVWTIIVPGAALAFEVKLHQEEQLMSSTFPYEYPAYRRKIPQLIPFLHLRRSQTAP